MVWNLFAFECIKIEADRVLWTRNIAYCQSCLPSASLFTFRRLSPLLAAFSLFAVHPLAGRKKRTLIKTILICFYWFIIGWKSETEIKTFIIPNSALNCCPSIWNQWFSVMVDDVLMAILNAIAKRMRCIWFYCMFSNKLP